MRPSTRQFALFLGTSGTSAIINLSTRYFMNFYMPYELAVLAAFPAGLLSAFFLARLFVFRDATRSIFRELCRFFVINMVGIVIVWCVSVSLLRLVFPAVGFVWHADLVAHAVGLGATAFTSYFGHKHYTFASGMDGTQLQ